MIEHGRLKSVGPNLTNLCKIAVNQALMGAVLVQLDEINEKISLIIQGQHDDRISEISGAIKSYEDCKILKEKKDINYDYFIYKLNTGVIKLEKELYRLLRGYSPKIKFTDNWFSNKNKKNKELYHHCRETILWILKGYITLFEINNTLSEYKKDINIKSFNKDFIKFLEEEDKWEILKNLSRGLEYKKNFRGLYPEEEIEEIINYKNLMKKELNISLNSKKNYYIIGKGKMIKEVLN